MRSTSIPMQILWTALVIVLFVLLDSARADELESETLHQLKFGWFQKAEIKVQKNCDLLSLCEAEIEVSLTSSINRGNFAKVIMGKRIPDDGSIYLYKMVSSEWGPESSSHTGHLKFTHYYGRQDQKIKIFMIQGDLESPSLHKIGEY